MSDNWIVLISEDPTFLPDKARQARARDRFAKIVPDASGIRLKVYDKIEFFDCGANLERILCPSCGAEIPTLWWQDRMSEDYADGFKLDRYAMPCCKRRH